MSRVEQLFADFVSEHRAGGAADPQGWLARVEGLDRRELAALIDAYLARAPRRRFDRADFEESGMGAYVDSLARSLGGSAGMWPAVLPRLRARTRIARDELAGQLADRLGAGGQRERVAHYYHQMEQGLLPSVGVSDEVLDALGKIVGETRAALRRAGEALPVTGSSAQPAGGPAPAFARSTKAPAEDVEVEALAAAPSSPTEWDELDRLFRGG